MDKIIRFVTTMLVISFSGLLGSSAVFADEIVKYSFLVKVPEIGVIPFTSCTGMGSESEVIELMVNIPGYNSNHIKNPRKVCSTNIVCKRPILPKTGIWEWQEHIVGKSGGIDYKENFSKDIFVVALDPQSQEMAWWYLYRAWPSKVVCLYDGERLIEEVVLVSDFTLRLNSPPTNWESYEPPTPGLSTVEPPKVEMSTGYAVAPGVKALDGQQVDLSGTWNSNIGLVYQISQSGNKFSYQDPMMHKLVNGTVVGKTITVSWTEGNVVKSLKGSITSVDGDSKAKSINWANGVIFNRLSTTSTQPPKIKAASGYVVTLGPKAQEGQQIDIAGKWTSNIGLIYQISQNGNNFSYQDPMMHKPVNGTVDGKTVAVSWMEGNAAKNLKGTVTEVGNNGKAKRIEWKNSVVFHR